MGIAERRSREKEAVRTLILEAARDLLSEQGLGGLSMRAIAERIEYSPATIYLHFRDKDELVREVVETAFQRMGAYVEAELGSLPQEANAAEQYAAMGRAYARFAIENTSYFRVMFELPACGHMDEPLEEPRCRVGSFDAAVEVVERATRDGLFGARDPRRTAVIGWGLIHGLVSLYLSGHLADTATSHEEFLVLIEEAMQSIDEGWKRDASFVRKA
jgi:AcrR family transcriptional regulator